MPSAPHEDKEKNYSINFTQNQPKYFLVKHRRESNFCDLYKGFNNLFRTQKALRHEA